MIKEGDNNDAVLYFVRDRKTKTLEHLIGEHIQQGTEVHTDGWKAYAEIDWEGQKLTYQASIS